MNEKLSAKISKYFKTLRKICSKESQSQLHQVIKNSSFDESPCTRFFVPWSEWLLISGVNLLYKASNISFLCRCSSYIKLLNLMLKFLMHRSVQFIIKALSFCRSILLHEKFYCFMLFHYFKIYLFSEELFRYSMSPVLLEIVGHFPGSGWCISFTSTALSLPSLIEPGTEGSGSPFLVVFQKKKVFLLSFSQIPTVISSSSFLRLLISFISFSVS